MRFEFFVAKRYFFSRKRKNIVNIITTISVIGVAIGTMALVVVLSVFNGFDGLIRSLFGSFDPDLKIEKVVGKTIDASDTLYSMISGIEGVEKACRVYEDNALVRYDERTHPVRLKGVEKEWWMVSGVDSMLIDGAIYTKYDSIAFCVVGRELSYRLGLGLHFIQPMHFYAPKKTSSREITVNNAFVSNFMFATGIFAIQSDIDSRYVIVPYSFTTELFQAENMVTAFEVKIKKGYDISEIQRQIESIIGGNYSIKTRIQQHEFLYKVMQAEKWIIYAILTFILIIASFSIIGSLMMLIIDKKEDSKTLRVLGAELQTIKRLFLYEGFFITLFGAISGMAVGYIICWIQQQFGLIKINVSGELLIDSYPVNMMGIDFFVIFTTVIAIGYFVSYYPVYFITKRYFGNRLKS